MSPFPFARFQEDADSLTYPVIQVADISYPKLPLKLGLVTEKTLFQCQMFFFGYVVRKVPTTMMNQFTKEQLHVRIKCNKVDIGCAVLFTLAKERTVD